jgi:hypothetical protein
MERMQRLSASVDHVDHVSKVLMEEIYKLTTRNSIASALDAQLYWSSLKGKEKRTDASDTIMQCKR